MADAITPISPGYVKVICGRYNVSPSKVYVVRAGVDLNKFKANAKANRKRCLKYYIVERFLLHTISTKYCLQQSS